MSDRNLFTCTQCGDCCKGFGGTYVSEEDVAAIAKYVGVEIDTFRRSYCVPSGRRLVLSQRPDGFCIFFNVNCTIHPVKPRMCRRWPFIESVLKDPLNWRIMSGECPGMKNEQDDEKLRAFVMSKMDPNPGDH